MNHIDFLLDTPHYIRGCGEFEKLRGLVLNENFVCVESIGNIGPFNDGPIINCKTLILNDCDKNFIYHWNNRKTFPIVENIFLLSHPCEYDVFHRWGEQPQVNIFISPQYQRYIDKWAHNVKNIYLLSQNDHNKLINLTSTTNKIPQKLTF